MKTYRVWFSPEDYTEFDASSERLLTDSGGSMVINFSLGNATVASFRYTAILGWEIVSEQGAD
jgi:hypothetical protein